MRKLDLNKSTDRAIFASSILVRFLGDRYSVGDAAGTVNHWLAFHAHEEAYHMARLKENRGRKRAAPIVFSPDPLGGPYYLMFGMPSDVLSMKDIAREHVTTPVRHGAKP